MFGKVKSSGFSVQAIAAPAFAHVQIDIDATLEYPSLNGTKNVDVHAAIDTVLRAIAQDRDTAVPELGPEGDDLVAYFPDRPEAEDTVPDG